MRGTRSHYEAKRPRCSKTGILRSRGTKATIRVYGVLRVNARSGMCDAKLAARRNTRNIKRHRRDDPLSVAGRMQGVPQVDPCEPGRGPVEAIVACFVRWEAFHEKNNTEASSESTERRHPVMPCTGKTQRVYLRIREWRGPHAYRGRHGLHQQVLPRSERDPEPPLKGDGDGDGRLPASSRLMLGTLRSVGQT